MVYYIKASIYPFALYEIPVSVVLTLGQQRYVFAAVPPQPNSQLAGITSYVSTLSQTILWAAVFQNRNDSFLYYTPQNIQPNDLELSPKGTTFPAVVLDPFP